MQEVISDDLEQAWIDFYNAEFAKGLESFLDYMDAGFRVFPLHNIIDGTQCGCGNPECKALGKHPKACNYQNTTERWDDDQLQSIKMGMQTGFGVLLDRHLVIDVDPQNGGEKSYERLVRDTGIDFMRESKFYVQTGGGGWHIYFNKPEGMLLRSSLPDYPGIDFKHSGFVVGWGSRHRKGGRYEREKGFPEEIGDAPTVLLGLLERPQIMRIAHDGAVHDVSVEQIEEMLTYVPNGQKDYQKYVDLGMAIHDATDGDGFEIWDTWCRRCEENDPQQNRIRWKSFHSGGGITAGTIFYHAQLGGWKSPVTFKPAPMPIEEETEVTDGVKIPQRLMSTVIGKLSERVAHCLEFPLASSYLALLGAASAAVSAQYVVRFQGSSSVLPTGLYIVVEQPPSTQKSRLLNIGMKPYEKAVNGHNEDVTEHNARIDEFSNGKPMLYAFDNATDATAAALEQFMSTSADGHFCIASAEQSAFISLFPEGNSFHSTNEIVLKGWVGDHVSGLRKGRKSFNGSSYGSIVLVAQPGSAARIFAASNGTGLSERFMYLSEESLLGRRTLHGEMLSDMDVLHYKNAIERCVMDYSNRLKADGVGRKCTMEELTTLKASNSGYMMILEKRRQIEKRMGDLNKAGEMVMLSWLGKIESHALKIAAVTHVIEARAECLEVPAVIPDDLIEASMELVDQMAEHLAGMLHTEGHSGKNAEHEAIITAIGEKPSTTREVALKLRRRAPFRTLGKDAYKRAIEAIKSMINDELVIVDQKGKLQNL